MSEASSTKIISLTKWVGDRSMTEWTVRNRVDQASLWKQIITLVVGSSDKKRSGALHLKLTRDRDASNFLKVSYSHILLTYFWRSTHFHIGVRWFSRIGNISQCAKKESSVWWILREINFCDFETTIFAKIDFTQNMTGIKFYILHCVYVHSMYILYFLTSLVFKTLYIKLTQTQKETDLCFVKSSMVRRNMNKISAYESPF